MKNYFLLFETLLAKSIILTLNFSLYIFRALAHRVLEINEDILRIAHHSTISFSNKMFRAKAKLEIPNFVLALSTISSTLSIEWDTLCQVFELTTPLGTNSFCLLIFSYNIKSPPWHLLSVSLVLNVIFLSSRFLTLSGCNILFLNSRYSTSRYMGRLNAKNKYC